MNLNECVEKQIKNYKQENGEAAHEIDFYNDGESGMTIYVKKKHCVTEKKGIQQMTIESVPDLGIYRCFIAANNSRTDMEWMNAAEMLNTIEKFIHNK